MEITLIATLLFILGLMTILWNRFNIIRMLLGAEMCLLAANWNLVAGVLTQNLVDGTGFILVVLAIAAAEVAVGLGLAVLVFRRMGTVSLDDLHVLADE